MMTPSSPSKASPTAKMGIISHYLSLLPDVILVVGLGFGWYTRWSHYGHNSLLILGFTGLFVFVLNFALQYYFRIDVLTTVSYLWIGCTLGIVAVFDGSDIEYRNLERMMNMLLISSLICQFFCEIFRKFCNRNNPAANSGGCFGFSRVDMAQLLGTAIACTMLDASHAFPMLCILLSFTTILLGMHLKCLVSFALLAFLMITSEVYVFPDIHMSVNPFAIIVLVGRLCVPPLVDFICSPFSRLDRWRCLILASKWKHYWLICVTLTLEVLFYFVHASTVRSHKEWYVVVPLFAVVSIVWFLLHLIFVMVIATLQAKFAGCRNYLQKSLADFADLAIGTAQLKQILAAKGLRYFALVALRFMYVSAFSDVLVEALCWTTRTPFSFALLATVLGVEFIFVDLLHEFSVSLGGTCIGYVVVAPTVPDRSDGGSGGGIGGISMLPPNYVQESGLRSTDALNHMVQFFSRHLIVQFGADWSMQGLDKAELSKKLRLFFAQTTVEGPRYDTYLLFYCGPTTASGGEWALTDNQTLSLDELLELWQDSASNSQRTASSARLLIIADSQNSSLWLKPVKRLRTDAVALQTHSVRKVDEFQIGLFTQQFCDFQSGLVTKFHQIRPSYAVSKLWTDFVFHMPSTMEVQNYWLQLLPRCVHGCFTVIIKIASYRIQSAFCGCILKRLRRLRMSIWPPSELDIGHGFKLVG